MANSFISCEIQDIVVGEALPVSLYVYLNFKFVTYRAAGDTVNRVAFDRLEFNKIGHVFVQETEIEKFREWKKKKMTEIPAAPAVAEAPKALTQARADVGRKLLDIFSSTHPDKVIIQTLGASKQLVTEIMKVPYAVQSLAQLQTFSKGTVDHSVNVSVLAVYLAMQMGYSHALILQHVGAGGLLHDIGKPKVPMEQGDSVESFADKMKEHPHYGVKFFEGNQEVPKEVLLIIEQHHENYDGTGYPKKLKGTQIYDLARIVSIANVFDELVSDGSGTLQERQRAAIHQLDQTLYKKFDPVKLDKALKILKLGL